MVRKRCYLHHVPRLCRHKPSGRAYVRIERRQVFLGPWGGPETQTAYKRVLAEWLAGGHRQTARTVAEAHDAFARQADEYYVHGKEAVEMRRSLRHVTELYGPTPAADFGAVQFRVVQTGMAKRFCRKTANQRLTRIKHAFKWYVGNGLLTGTMLPGILAVESMRRGLDHPLVTPVPWTDVEATLPHLPPEVARLVLFGWWSGSRHGELVRLRVRNLDTTGPVGSALLQKHETAQHERPHSVSG